MSKLIGRRVMVTSDRSCYEGMVGTVVEVRYHGTFLKVRLTFYGYDTRPFFNPEQLRYLNNREVVL